MSLPPFRILKRWCEKGRTAPPAGSRHGRDGISRRATVSMLLASLTASQFAAYGIAEAAGQRAWFHVKPITAGQPKALYAHPNWTGSSITNTNDDQIDAVNDIPMLSDGVVRGDGPWPEPAFANIDVFEGTHVKPGQIVMLLGANIAPDLSGVEKVLARFAGGPIVEFKPSDFVMGPEGVPGFPVRLFGGGKGGIGWLSTMTVPYQGIPTVCSKKVVVNDTGALKFDQFFLSPGGNDGAVGTAAAPWQTIAKACLAATNGAEVVMAAGTYDILAGPSGNRHNNLMLRFRAADGLTKDQVLIDAPTAPEGGVVGTAVPASATAQFRCSAIDLDTVTFVTGRLPGLRVYGGRATVTSLLHWRNYTWTTDQSTDYKRIGLAGTTYDPVTGITDPDEIAIPNSGGFGGSPFASSLDGFLYSADGSKYGFTNGTFSTMGCKGDCFRKNVVGSFGYDANIFNSYSGKERYADGQPRNSYDDVLFVNVTQCLPSATAYKGRQHDHKLVRIVSIDQTWSGTGTVKAAGDQNASNFKTGLALVTLDGAPNAPASCYFQQRLSTTVDDFATFMAGGSAGVTRGGSYLTDSPIKPGYGTTYYGWRFYAIGPQTATVNGASVPMSQGSGTTAIGGKNYTQGPTQVLISIDPAKIAVGDYVELANAIHTDALQTAGAGITGNTSNRKNYMLLNIESYGTGGGNLFLYQFDQGTISTQVSFDDQLNWAMQNVQSPVVVATLGGITLTSPPTTIDGIATSTLTQGDLIAVKNQSPSSQNGIYAWQGGGDLSNARVDDGSTFNKIWAIQKGTQGRYGTDGKETNLGQFVTTSPTSSTNLAPSWSTSRVMLNDCWAITDTTTASNGTTNKFNSSFVATVAADGLSGTLTRAWIDKTTKARTNPGSVVATRLRTICGVLTVNMRHSGSNLGQIGPTARCFGMFACTFTSQTTPATVTVRCDGTSQGFQGLVFVDVFADCGFSIADTAGGNADPHAWATLINCMSGAGKTTVASRFGGNYPDFTTAAPANPIVQGGNEFGTGATVDMTGSPDPTFRTLGYVKTGRTKPQMMFDAAGLLRTNISPVGAMAA